MKVEHWIGNFTEYWVPEASTLYSWKTGCLLPMKNKSLCSKYCAGCDGVCVACTHVNMYTTNEITLM